MRRPHVKPSAANVALAGGAIGAVAAWAAWRAMAEPTGPRYRGDAPPASWRHQPQGMRGMSHTVSRTVTINRPRQQLYDFWRNFAQLPRFMQNIVSVEDAGGGRSRWTIAGPAGMHYRFESEIVEDVAGEVIAWRSLQGGDVENRGRITFRDAPAGRGTEVEAEIAWIPPYGEAGRMIAKLFQREPHIQARRDLRRFKQLMETGEIATSAVRREDA